MIIKSKRRSVRQMCGVVQMLGYFLFLVFVIAVNVLGLVAKQPLTLGVAVVCLLWMMVTFAVKVRMVIDACGRRVHLFSVGFFVVLWLAVHGPHFPLQISIQTLSLIDILVVGFFVVMTLGDVVDLVMIPRRSARTPEPVLLV